MGLVSPVIPPAKFGGRRRTADIRAVFDAMRRECSATGRMAGGRLEDVRSLRVRKVAHLTLLDKSNLPLRIKFLMVLSPWFVVRMR